MIHRVDEELFKRAKRRMIFASPYRVARAMKMSLKTALQIKGSKTYEEYRAQCKAQHPVVRYSLADDVMSVHRTLFNNGDGEYQTPPSAQLAMVQIKARLAE